MYIRSYRYVYNIIQICIQSHTDMRPGMDRIYIAWEADLICKATSSVKTRLSGDILPKVTILSQQAWELSAWEQENMQDR